MYFPKWLQIPLMDVFVHVMAPQGKLVMLRLCAGAHLICGPQEATRTHASVLLSLFAWQNIYSQMPVKWPHGRDLVSILYFT